MLSSSNFTSIADGTRAVTKRMDECINRLNNHEDHILSIAELLKNLNLKLTTMEAKFDQNFLPKQEIATGSSFVPDPPVPSDPASDWPIINPFRKICLDVSRFNGSDPHAWIFATEQFFHFHTLSDDKRLSLISFHMDGPALIWCRWMFKINRLSTWDSFLTDLLK